MWFLSRLEPLFVSHTSLGPKAADQASQHSLLPLHRDAVTFSHSCPSLTHSVSFLSSYSHGVEHHGMNISHKRSSIRVLWAPELVGLWGHYCSLQGRSEVGFKGKLCRGTVRGSRLMHWFADSLPDWGVHVVPCLWRLFFSEFQLLRIKRVCRRSEGSKPLEGAPVGSLRAPAGNLSKVVEPAWP